MIMQYNSLLRATDSLVLAVNDLDSLLGNCQTLTHSEKTEIRNKFTTDVAFLKNRFSEASKQIQVIEQTKLLLESGKLR